MGRGKKQVSKSNTNNYVVKIDYEQLARAIVQANEMVRRGEEREKQKQEEYEKAEWNKIIHYKEYPSKEKLCLKWIHNIRNCFWVICAAIFFKKENAKTPRITFNLLRESMYLFFSVCEGVLNFLAIAMFIYGIGHLESWLVFVTYAFLLFMFGRILRVVKFEIRNIKDRELLMSLTSTITSYIAMVIAIIALFQSY